MLKIISQRKCIISSLIDRPIRPTGTAICLHIGPAYMLFTSLIGLLVILYVPFFPFNCII